MQIKQVIVVRNDLKMGKGKLIAQACHASIAFICNKIRENIKLSGPEKEWIVNRFTKVCFERGVYMLIIDNDHNEFMEDKRIKLPA